MFRLDVSHLQAPTISLPDALSTLGSQRESLGEIENPCPCQELNHYSSAGNSHILT